MDNAIDPNLSPDFLYLGLLKRFGIGHNEEGSSNDDVALINGVDHDVLHRVNSVCADMVQQLCSALDLKKVLCFSFLTNILRIETSEFILIPTCIRIGAY